MFHEVDLGKNAQMCCTNCGICALSLDQVREAVPTADARSASIKKKERKKHHRPYQIPSLATHSDTPKPDGVLLCWAVQGLAENQ